MYGIKPTVPVCPVTPVWLFFFLHQAFSQRGVWVSFEHPKLILLIFYTLIFFCIMQWDEKELATQFTQNLYFWTPNSEILATALFFMSIEICILEYLCSLVSARIIWWVLSKIWAWTRVTHELGKRGNKREVKNFTNEKNEQQNKFKLFKINEKKIVDFMLQYIKSKESYCIINMSNNEPIKKVCNCHLMDVFCWEPQACYCCIKSMVIAPFLFSMEHCWTVLMPFWLSTNVLCE